VCADRLKSHFPDTEQLAHLAADFRQMCALPERVEDENRFLHHDFTGLFDRPFSVDGHEIVQDQKRARLLPGGWEGAERTRAKRRSALKEAKTSGEKYLHHRIEMNSELARRVGMEHRLRTALDDDQFVLHYSRKSRCARARLQASKHCCVGGDPGNGLIAPGIFCRSSSPPV